MIFIREGVQKEMLQTLHHLLLDAYSALYFFLMTAYEIQGSHSSDD
jgi:hypothetical protein